ncbi:ABC transporter related protein [Streptomyces hygroscopicus]|nr:ABC transporter related protein [Streptomyces hygroscopicus]
MQVQKPALRGADHSGGRRESAGHRPAGTAPEDDAQLASRPEQPEDAIKDVSAVLPDTLYPQLPGLVQVSRPSDALLAKRATRTTFSALFLGLAGVALLVGGIGVANTMYISVLERRTEIGLRRALGAGRGQIRASRLPPTEAPAAA